MAPAPLRLVQISDTHLYRDPAGRLMGLDTQASLDAVLVRLRETFWPPDALLLTGDLVHDMSPEGYRRLAARLSDLGVPAHCLPGNHDDPTLLREYLGGPGIHTGRCADLGDWRLVLLDSTLAGEDSGVLSQHELQGLDICLGEAPDRPALICLHHQPVPVGSSFMDAMALINADDFFAVLDRHPQVRGVLWGHVHQAFSGERNGVGLFGCPSTCVQFLPGAERFGLDEQPPGFRWLLLHADGRIETGIIRLEAQSSAIDRGAPGY